jgi:hypothetical protein
VNLPVKITPPPLSTGAKQSGEIRSVGHAQSLCNAQLRRIAPTLLTGVLAIMTATLNAQKAPSQQFTVNVTDQSGAVIPAAAISITNAATGQRAAAVTNEQGSAVMTLEPGAYQLVVQATGFDKSRKEIDFPEENLVSLTLMVSRDGCGVCVTPGPIFLETTPSEINDLLAYEPIYPLPFGLRPHRIRSKETS